VRIGPASVNDNIFFIFKVTTSCFPSIWAYHCYPFPFHSNYWWLEIFRSAASNYLRKAGEIHGTVGIYISVGKLLKHLWIIYVPCLYFPSFIDSTSCSKANSSHTTRNLMFLALLYLLICHCFNNNHHTKATMLFNFANSLAQHVKAHAVFPTHYCWWAAHSKNFQ